MTVITQPNWSFVTDMYQEPKSFTDLLQLLTPRDRQSEDRAYLTWKEKEFYKKENVVPFIHYAVQTAKRLPKFHRDEFPALLRIVHLYIVAEMYEEGYQFFYEQKLHQFVVTSLAFPVWDHLTKAMAWNYLILKNRQSKLDETDDLIWERIKFDEDCVKSCSQFLSHKDILLFMFMYLCKKARFMKLKQLEESVMVLSIYCNNHLTDLYEYKLYGAYQRCTEMLTEYELPPAVLACQRAVMSQLVSLFNLSFSFVDDFLFEIKEIIEHMDFQLACTYGDFIGKLLSYIPFFEMVVVPRHAYYVQDILYMCKGIGYREDLIRNYFIPQLTAHFLPCVKPFLHNKQYSAIHEILFYWCTDEQRAQLERQYNLEVIYEKYAQG